jgi:hypothetical protein
MGDNARPAQEAIKPPVDHAAALNRAAPTASRRTSAVVACDIYAVRRARVVPGAQLGLSAEGKNWDALRSEDVGSISREQFSQ